MVDRHDLKVKISYRTFIHRNKAELSFVHNQIVLKLLVPPAQETVLQPVLFVLLLDFKLYSALV